MLLFMTMEMAEPTADEVKDAALVNVTFNESAEMTPTKVPAVTDALVVLSYSLFETAVPVTVNSLGVIFAVTGFG